MSPRQFYLTKEKLKELKKEYEVLKKLRAVKTRNEAPSILESEDINPEWLSFREDLDLLEMRLAEVENILKNVKIIRAPSKKNQAAVAIGATVFVEIDGEDDEFRIVGTLEADPAENKISDESPIGRALLGRKVGETAVIRVPAKAPIVNHSCKIKKIRYI